jgi:cell division control protein 7
MNAPPFSSHSSNPLEVSTSNSLNNTYIQIYNDAQDSEMMSSEDLGGYHMPEIQKYRAHIKALKGEGEGVQESLIDLDEDMSDDELGIGDEPGDEGEEGVMIDEDEDEEIEGELAEGDVDALDSDLDIPDSDDSECATLALKPVDERLEIRSEITQLINLVPDLSPSYHIFDRLGTGTFSSVYKAADLSYSSYYNSCWHGHHPPSSSAYYQSKIKEDGENVFVAIKRIYVTSSPERIKNEITIMEDCRGCRHVSQLITAFRHEDQVVAIMPYHKNDDFRVRFPLYPVRLC